MQTFYAENAEAWRTWLEQNHQTQPHVWLIYYKKIANKPRVDYSDAVDEALCFGWIDSTAKPIDEFSYMQYFCPRKPKSGWSRVNKAKIEVLAAANKIAPAGWASIEIAKKNGSWTALDDVEAGIIPPDLQKAFDAHPQAAEKFATLSRSNRRNLLANLFLAKRQDTRDKRIANIIDSLQ
jgi:uncharacterized protein YdeI (YjbR/CyaY-like superfamily)